MRRLSTLPQKNRWRANVQAPSSKLSAGLWRATSLRRLQLRLQPADPNLRSVACAQVGSRSTTLNLSKPKSQVARNLAFGMLVDAGVKE
jgi:hypothetical protein